MFLLHYEERFQMQEGKTSSYTHRLPVPRTRGVPALPNTPSTPQKLSAYLMRRLTP